MNVFETNVLDLCLVEKLESLKRLCTPLQHENVANATPVRSKDLQGRIHTLVFETVSEVHSQHIENAFGISKWTEYLEQFFVRHVEKYN